MQIRMDLFDKAIMLNRRGDVNQASSRFTEGVISSFLSIPVIYGLNSLILSIFFTFIFWLFGLHEFTFRLMFVISYCVYVYDSFQIYERFKKMIRTNKQMKSDTEKIKLMKEKEIL